jgi:hypothetical protein
MKFNTFFERWLASLYLSDQWSTSGDISTNPKHKLYCRTRAVVIYDRILTDQTRGLEKLCLIELTEFPQQNGSNILEKK